MQSLYHPSSHWGMEENGKKKVKYSWVGIKAV